ncbi:acyl carrier protein [Solimonas marina]|uniref:Acyl carrier protein n=1 Tax=Solimonas marina TaxID=2714601 RepID=A0A970BAE9_9GAMM|nr:phosphopantetheine-binding protein [Solimonas marina]NKF23301.1 acyl carrier protein [Solimonas marina]
MKQISEIREQIISGLAQARPDAPDINGSTRIVQDLELDSVAVMDFILSVEDRFDISIPLDRVADIVTVDDLARVVEGLCNAERA